MDSRNGTYVNGQRITGAHPLQPGDTIVVGNTELVYQVGSRDTPLQPGARLSVVQGTCQPPSLDLRGKAAYVIGRESSNDILIAGDALVSRRHAQLRAVPGGHEIEDLGSVNGLFVNGQRVPRAALRSGDRIRIGTTELLYQA
jgi:pSer/pThr/pTyr-binding forkhead associated (FHA) protein